MTLVTGAVSMVNFMLELPAGITTVALAVPLLRITAAPPVGAGPLRITSPCVDTPPVTLAGVIVKLLNAVTGADAVTVSTEVFVTPP